MTEKDFVETSIEALNNITGIDATIATNSINENLPTAEEYLEYLKQLGQMSYDGGILIKWSEPKYQCPECGGGMCKNLTTILTSLPPQYQYKCNKCGRIETQYF